MKQELRQLQCVSRSILISDAEQTSRSAGIGGAPRFLLSLVVVPPWICGNGTDLIVTARFRYPAMARGVNV